MPIRLIVGHKGIGKSALFQVAQRELHEKNVLTLSLTPDDISDISEDEADMLKLIRKWKEGLSTIIATKAISQFAEERVDLKGKTDCIINIVKKSLERITGIDLEDEKKAIQQYFLANKKIVVFIDDLDRGWEGKRSDIKRVSALLNAVRDLARENTGIRFKISLRTDVYYLYRTSDESTDKVEGSVVWLTWNNFSILALLTKRIVTFFGGVASEKDLLNSSQQELADILNFVFDAKFYGSGSWGEIPTYRLLTSLIRKRPRDLIKLCTLAAKEAHKNRHEKILSEDFKAIFERYSQGRLNDTIIEFRSELPDVERLLLNMKPSTKEKAKADVSLYTSDELYKKINNIMQGGAFYFANSKKASVKELASFLYKINFLTARKNMPDRIERKYFEENNFLMTSVSDFGYSWEVHPAYRWALQPENIQDVLNHQIVIE